MQIGSRKERVRFQNRTHYQIVCAELLFLLIILPGSLLFLPQTILAQDTTPNATPALIEEPTDDAENATPDISEETSEEAIDEATSDEPQEYEEAASPNIGTTPESIETSDSESADSETSEMIKVDENMISAIISSSELISTTILQSETTVRHISFLQDALSDADLPEARRHTEHIINTLDGESGLLFGDLDEDGFAQNPGDGRGVRVYIDDMLALIDSIASNRIDANTNITSDDSTGVSINGDSIQDISDALLLGSELTSEATGTAAKIFAVDTITETQIIADELKALVEAIYAQNVAVQTALSAAHAELGLEIVTTDASADSAAKDSATEDDEATINEPATAQRLERAEVQAILAILAKAGDEAEIAAAQTESLQRATTAVDLQEVRQNAEEVINILDGENGILFGDVDRDGAIQNSGSGTGVRVYLEGAGERAIALADSINSIDALQMYMRTAGMLLESIDEGETLMPKAFEQSLLIFASDTVTEARVYADELTAHVIEIQAVMDRASESTRVILEAVSDDESSPDSTSGFSSTGPPETGISGEVWQSRTDQANYIFVPAGGFTIGAIDSLNAAANERPAHTLVLDAFWIAQAETTNAQYATCVDADVCTSPNNERWNQVLYADHPVTHVDWAQATTYAEWAGGRLPTEGEWEKACRGMTYRTYPWGNEQPTADFANVGTATGTTTAVGLYPDGASLFGLFDMSGNVREWTMSLEQPYPYRASDGREDLFANGSRIARGGAYSQPAFEQRCTVRTPTPAATADPLTGFRIVIGTGQDVWTNPMDNASYALIPAGDFVMGLPPADAVYPNESPEHSISVETFWMQETETTNARYGLCVLAGDCTPPENEIWDLADYAEHPVTHIDWAQATAYATWVNGRLPTEAEWEKACRGTGQRLYPWGAQPPTEALSNFNYNVGQTTAVGSYPTGASPYGVQDMSGSVGEWTSSLSDKYPYDGSDGREDLEGNGPRVARGGSFYDAKTMLRCVTRSVADPSDATPQLGFRVVISDPE